MFLFSPEEEQEIITAIIEAESGTSGEIRVHLERTCDKPAIERAAQVFHFLKMDQIKDENAVLIYIDKEDKKFALFGGKGIDQKIPDDFWEKIVQLMSAEFKQENFKTGVTQAIQKIGEKLKEFFPSDNKYGNELSDEISKS